MAAIGRNSRRGSVGLSKLQSRNVNQNVRSVKPVTKMAAAKRGTITKVLNQRGFIGAPRSGKARVAAPAKAARAGGSSG